MKITVMDFITKRQYLREGCRSRVLICVGSMLFKPGGDTNFPERARLEGFQLRCGHRLPVDIIAKRL